MTSITAVPKSIGTNLAPYSKFLTAIAGLALTILVQKYGSGTSTWLPYVTGALAALGVYAVPNVPKPAAESPAPEPYPTATTTAQTLPGTTGSG